MRIVDRFTYPVLWLLVTAMLTLGAIAGCGNSGSGDNASGNEAGSASTQIAGEIQKRNRLLSLNTTNNARDLGGYSTHDGRSVKWGMLFRTDSLASLDEADLEYVGQLQLAEVTDFRSDSERASAPDRLPQQSPPISYRTLAINNPAMDVKALGEKVFSGQLSQEELLALLDRKNYIEDPAISRMWGQWLASLAEPGKLPHLYHCTAGKDRTGFASAIILLTLGVPEDQVMEDFLLSNHYLQARIEQGVSAIQAQPGSNADADVLRQVLGVSRSSLQGALEAMKEQYGSVDAYIEQGLGIDQATRKKLQSLLLE